MKEKIARPDLDLLQLVMNEVHRQLDLELLRIDECLAVMPSLMRAKERGVHVRIGLPLANDPGFPGRVWGLEPLLARRVEIPWCSNIRDQRLIVDGRQAYRVDGNRVSPEVGRGNSPPSIADGQLKIFSGEVHEKQGRYARFDRLDQLLFVRIGALGERIPIFFSSERTPVEALSPGDQIKMLVVINWSGSGVFSAFAPSELSYEGIDFRRIVGMAHG